MSRKGLHGREQLFIDAYLGLSHRLCNRRECVTTVEDKATSIQLLVTRAARAANPSYDGIIRMMVEARTNSVILTCEVITKMIQSARES